MNTNCAKVMKLQEQGRDEEKNKSAETSKQLPDEIIFYILTFLPLSSLFKFKCVCKLWNTLFLHPHFSYLYDLRGLHLKDVKMSTAMLKVPFTRISRSSQGLFLEKTSSASCPLRYRIWCPTFRQRHAIPNPQNPSICMTLEFVPSNQAVKLVSVHEDEHSFGYEILALRIGIYQNTYTWRAVKVPPPPNLQKQNSEPSRKRKSIEVFFRKEVAYCIWYVETEDDDLDIEVDVLDMVNESYIGHTTFPGGGFFPKLSLSNINLLDWNDQLSFAQLVKDELHVLVLDDYRKLKWAESKRIIKLTFLKPDNKELFTFFTCVDKATLFFVGRDKKSLCMYDIYTGKLMTGKMYMSIDSIEQVAILASQLMFYREGNRLGINGVLEFKIFA